MKLKVLHITNAYPTEKYSSYGIFIKEQIDSLNSLDVKNDVLFINAREKGVFEYLKSTFRIRKLSKKYDLVHCHHLYSAAAYIFSFSKKPFIVSILGDIESRNKRLDKFLFGLMKRISKKIIVKKTVTEELRSDKIMHCPNGVNLSLFTESDKNTAKDKLGLSRNVRYALFVSASGKSNSIKRFDKFTDVLQKLEDEDIKLEPLILSGVKREDVPLYYNASDIMLLTSDHEGSPNAVKEAMACNISVVSTDVGNVKEMLDGCVSSFVSDDNSVASITELIKRALNISERNEREMLISKKLDMPSISKRISDLYTQFVTNPKSD